MPATSSRPAFPDANIIVLILCSGLLLGGGRRAVRTAVAAHQGLLSRGRDARRAVLPVVVLRARAVARQLQRLQRDRGADPHDVRHPGHRPERDADRALSRRALDRGLHDLDRRPISCAAASGACWMAVRDMDIAAELIGIRLYRTKLLAFAISSFYCGVAGALMVFLWLGAAEADCLQHQRILPDPVHGDHRRARQPDRLVLRRGLDLGPADRAARRAGIFRHCRSAPRPSSICSS